MKAKSVMLAIAASAFLSSFAFAGTGSGTGTGTTTGTGTGSVGTLAPDTNSSDFLQPFVQWMTNKPNGAGSYWVGYTLVTNKGAGLASYSAGTLTYHPAVTALINGKKVTLQAYFIGTANQLFSDRTYAWPNNDPSIINISSYPFNPFKPDSLGLMIYPATGNVTLTLKSWGNAAVTFGTTAEPVSGVIYGVGQLGSTLPAQMAVISLQKGYQAPIH